MFVTALLMKIWARRKVARSNTTKKIDLGIFSKKHLLRDEALKCTENKKQQIKSSKEFDLLRYNKP